MRTTLIVAGFLTLLAAATLAWRYFGRAAPPAVSRRAAGRPAAGAVDRLGYAPARVGWSAVVPSLFEREDRPPRRAPLDAPAAELELHVRGLPLDERPQELRRGRRSLRH